MKESRKMKEWREAVGTEKCGKRKVVGGRMRGVGRVQRMGE